MGEPAREKGDKARRRRGAPGAQAAVTDALVPPPHPPPLSCLSPGVVRASSIFPILSAILLLLGGVCVAASRVYKSKRNIILGAGILFVAAGERQREGTAHLRARTCVCVCVRARARAPAKPPCRGSPWGPEPSSALSQAPSPPAGRGRCSLPAVFSGNEPSSDRCLPRNSGFREFRFQSRRSGRWKGRSLGEVGA